jgi:hypothetical protein
MSLSRIPGRSLLVVLLCTGLGIVPDLARSTEIPLPAEAVILTVTGNISVSNDSRGVIFDRGTLESLGVSTLRSATPWTDGVQEFEGVLLSRLLQALGAKGETLIALALNDYTASIPMREAFEYPLLLALKMNGNYMRIRDKGPIWLVYPWDRYPELDTAASKRHSIWQLKEMEVR